jgi:SAM-dependent methyltransferase
MLECSDKKEWFASWFDTTYYHILYAHRTHDEASDFIRELVAFLKPKAGARALDLACGKGRHSVELAKYQMDVTGVDLSGCSIAAASEHTHATLHFEVQDMRSLSFSQPFDFIFNLFTSFGYFDCDRDNAKVLEQVYMNLRPGGIFVLDYFNAALIDAQSIHEQTIERDGVQFHIKKWVDGGNVLKQIHVVDGDFNEVFQEKVQLLLPDAIATLLQQAGFRIFARFGNYQLEEMNLASSPRCLMIVEKPL